jgi:hypothetical protein
MQISCLCGLLDVAGDVTSSPGVLISAFARCSQVMLRGWLGPYVCRHDVEANGSGDGKQESSDKSARSAYEVLVRDVAANTTLQACARDTHTQVISSRWCIILDRLDTSVLTLYGGYLAQIFHVNSAGGLPARVQIPVPPSATSRLLYELLGRVRLGFLVVFFFRIACVFPHVERGRSSKQVWRSPRIIYLSIFYVVHNR